MPTQTLIDTAPIDPEIRVPPPAQAARRFRRIRSLAWGIVVVVLAALAIRVLPNLLAKPPTNLIQASGRIEGRDVTLAAKEIQGRVKALLVDEGVKVQQGQLLAELESQQLDARLAALNAHVASIDAQIQQASIDVGFTTKTSAASIAAAEAAVSVAAARLARSQAVLANNKAEFQRQTGLFQDSVISRSELDQATMHYRTSDADTRAAEEDLLQAKANLVIARTSTDTIAVKQHQLRSLREARRAAAAQLAEAQANVEERKIVAPVAGTILSRTVEVGDVVNPGSPIFVLVDLDRLYLKVYVPEPDIPKLTLGAPAQITVDAFPGRTFAARISRISDEAEFTPKNVETRKERVKLVFGVELTFVQPDPALKPGMPADCIIRWEMP